MCAFATFMKKSFSKLIISFVFFGRDPKPKTPLSQEKITFHAKYVSTTHSSGMMAD